MKHSTLFLFNAIVAVIFGLAFIFIPTTTADIYDVDVTDASVLIGRLFGAALLSICVLTWYVRNAGPSPERQGIVLALFLGNAVALVVSVIAVINGVVNAFGWFSVALYLILAAGYGYLRFIREPEVARPRLST
jgi:hypothetical protein